MALFSTIGTGTAHCSSHLKHLRLLAPQKRIVVFAIKSINFDVCAGLFSAADRCFPRARLQPPCPGKGYVDVVRKERF